MSTKELKKVLIEKIESIEDKNLLLEASRLLKTSISENEVVYQLDNDLVNMVKESQEQVAKGNFLTHDEVIRETEKWLGK